MFDRSRPVLLVVRHADGDWSFACGQADHGGAEQDEDYVWIGVGELVARDASLDPLPELKADEIAERAAQGSAWMTYPV